MKKTKTKFVYTNGKRYEIDTFTIKVFRTVLGYTQTEIASVLGVKRSTIANWENGYSETTNMAIVDWYLSHGLLEFNEAFLRLRCEFNVYNNGAYLGTGRRVQ